MNREEALNAITAFVENYACGSDLDGLREAIEALKERPHGEWIEHTIKTGWSNSSTMYECSTCRSERWHSFKWSFCPVCGADMRTQNDRSWDTSERGASGSVENSITQKEGEEK